MQSQSRRFGSRGFTLVELLVVVSIIALLLALLLPSLHKARKQAKALLCKTRLRALSTGAFTYVTEWGVYPPSLTNFAESDNPTYQAKRWQGGVDWLGIGDQGGAFQEGIPTDPQTGNPKGFTAAPRFGALWPYVRDHKCYVCPEDKPGEPDAISLAGGGGNGKFSFTIFSNLGLYAPERIPPGKRKISGGSRGGAKYRQLKRPPAAKTPIFVEEHPLGINDRSSQGHMEGNFNYDTDKVVSRHVAYTTRWGIRPGDNKPTKFEQGSTHIGFGDGHVEGVKVNYGFTVRDVSPTGAGGLGYEGIPWTASGLMWHYGINDKRVIDAATGLEKDLE
jgi:prepilin-type N-terminal cleavage/methylation domain-containing protein/prepilin-type processing-associated H-X9-DG protein